MIRKEEELDKRQREIRQNRNTAQTVFVEKMTDLIAREGANGKNLRELQFPIALSGSLDFSNLPIAIKMVISRLNKLSFLPGEITDVKGWNEIRHLEELNLSKQLITEMDLKFINGLLVWKNLNLEGNGIKELAWSSFMYLKQVNLSYNRFVRLATLPRTLEIIDVRNNRLELLDLSRGLNLRYINASNNTSQMVIVPPPRENVDYELIQNHSSPYLETEMEDIWEEDTPEKVKPGEKREAMIRKMDYQEGLKEYFGYKSVYERKVAQEKRVIWDKYRSGKKGSVSMARQMLSRYIPTCLNCQQPGGMIFRFLPDEKKYKAICGATRPCSFRIEIYRSGNYMRLTDVLEQTMEYSEDCKQDLITAKQEIFFGYVDELSGLKKSKRILEECEEAMSHVRLLEEEYENLYDVERQSRIGQLTLKIGEWITQNEALLHPESGVSVTEILNGHRRRGNSKSDEKDWEEEVTEEEEKGREEERIRMVVETELCQLFPLIHQLRKETYDTMKIIEEGEKEGYRLFQEPISFSRGEYNLGTEPAAVIQFSE